MIEVKPREIVSVEGDSKPVIIRIVSKYSYFIKPMKTSFVINADFFHGKQIRVIGL